MKGRETFVCIECGIRIEGRANPVTGQVHAYDRGATTTKPGEEKPALCSECARR